MKYSVILLASVVLSTNCVGQGQPTKMEVLRGLSWNISKNESKQILSSKFGLIPNAEKTKEQQELVKDKGEWLVFEADIDTYPTDLALRFIDNKLIEIEYFYSTSVFPSLYSVYKIFYDGLVQKYGKPTCFDTSGDCKEIELLTFAELKEIIGGHGGDAKEWNVKKIATDIKLHAFYSFQGYEKNLYVVVTYKPNNLKDIKKEDKF